jgi:hypothetical protein
MNNHFIVFWVSNPMTDSTGKGRLAVKGLLKLLTAEAAKKFREVREEQRAL